MGLLLWVGGVEWVGEDNVIEDVGYLEFVGFSLYFFVVC